MVEVREVDPPETVKEPLHWLLLTSLSVETVDDAHRIVRFYTYRWLVERLHLVLKSGGCQFEESQLRHVEALYRLLGLCSRSAWRLLWLTYQARQTPTRCTLYHCPVSCSMASAGCI
ncbi:MAG: transposase [Chloroflexi bacterium]|nr:transposase [Chloroflexota bacterium]